MKLFVCVIVCCLMGCLFSSPAPNTTSDSDSGSGDVETRDSDRADDGTAPEDAARDSQITLDAQQTDAPVAEDVLVLPLCDAAVLTHDFEDLNFNEAHPPLANVARVPNVNAPDIFFEESAAVFIGNRGLEAPHDPIWENTVGSMVIQVTIERRPIAAEVFAIVAKDMRNARLGDLELSYDENGAFTFRLQDDVALDVDRQVSVIGGADEPATFIVIMSWDELSMRLDVDGSTDSRAIDNTGGLTTNFNPIAFGITNSRKDPGQGDYGAELNGKIHYFSLYDRKLSDDEIAVLPNCVDEL